MKAIIKFMKSLEGSGVLTDGVITEIIDIIKILILYIDIIKILLKQENMKWKTKKANFLELCYHLYPFL